jgi:hypothetical protein
MNAINELKDQLDAIPVWNNKIKGINYGLDDDFI